MKGFVVVILCLTCFLFDLEKKQLRKYINSHMKQNAPIFFLRLTERIIKTLTLLGADQPSLMCVHVWNCRQYFCRLIVFFFKIELLYCRFVCEILSKLCSLLAWLVWGAHARRVWAAATDAFPKFAAADSEQRSFFFLVRVRTKSSKLDRFVKQSLHDGVETVVLVVTFFWTRFDRI